MAANFGLLGAIAPPQQIATLPQQQAQGPSQLDTFAGGLMNGLQSGQAMQSQAAAMKAQEQSMMLRAAEEKRAQSLFPGQQQIQQQTIKQNDMALAKQSQEEADQAALRAAAKGGPDQYFETLYSQDPNKAVEYQFKQQQYQNSLLQGKSSLLDLNVKQREQADRDNTINVGVMNQVSQLPPEQQQQEYLKYKNDLQKKYPDLVMPDEFNADTMASVMRTNQIMAAGQKDEATEKVKTLTQLQGTRDNLEANKRSLQAAGKPTTEIDRRIKETDSLIQTHVANKQTTVSDEDKISGKMVDLDIDDYKADAELARSADKNIADAEVMKQISSKFPTGFAGEARLAAQKAYSALTGKDIKSTKFGELIESQGTEFTLKYTAMTKGAISDAEMALFQRAAPGLSKTGEGIRLLMDVYIKSQQRLKDRADMKREYLQENKSLKGFNKVWDGYMEANPIIDPKELEPYTGKKSDKSGDQPITKTIGDQSYVQRDGKWYVQ